MRTPAATDRPTLAGSRRTNWKVFLFQEWGLLLLAAALAIIIWEITSLRVVKPRTLLNVEIQLEVDAAIRDRVGAVLLGSEKAAITKNFEITCSEREKNEALEALDADGRPVVVMRVTQPEDGSRDLNARLDKYAWPFANHERILIPGTAEAPAGRVFALAQANPRVGWPDQEQATLPKKSELDKRGIGVQIKFSRPTVGVMAPKGRENTPAYTLLTPDPINLDSVAGALVAAGDIPFDRPLPYDLTFEGWKSPTDPVEAAWRRQLDLPPIKATVTLTQTWEDTYQNRVIVQLPQEYQTELDRQAIEGLNLGGKLLFDGKLRGPKSVLDDLAKDRDAWAWGIEITDPSELPDGTMDNGPSPFKKLSARFFWYCTHPRFLDKGVRFVTKPGQDAFDIKVRWNKRKK